MLNDRRTFFTLSFLTCFLACFGLRAQDESFIRESLQGKFNEKRREEFFLSSKVDALSKLFRIDLNFDSYKDALLLKATGHQQEILIFNGKKELVTTFSMPYVGFRSSTLKYSLKKLGKKKFLVIFYFSEGRINYLEKSSKVRTYLLTINDSIKKENLYFQRGPILMEEFSSKRHEHLSTSSLELTDLDKDGVKDIVIESASGRKSIYVLNKEIFWEQF